jgi:hypothetical protein
LIEAPWFGEVFPSLTLGDKVTEESLTTDEKGFRLSTSVHGALTGMGGDFLIIDNPTKAEEAWSDARRDSVNDWLRHTALSRLDDKREGGILINMQRQHVGDLTGTIRDQSEEDWVVLSLPAIAQAPERFELPDGRVFMRAPGEALHPEREPLEILEALRRQMGVFDFSPQYLQQPVPVEGNILKWSWFKTFTLPISRENDDDIVQSWDTASKGEEHNDYSVCTTWLQRGDDHYLIDVFRERLNYPDLKKKIV